MKKVISGWDSNTIMEFISQGININFLHCIIYLLSCK